MAESLGEAAQCHDPTLIAHGYAFHGTVITSWPLVPRFACGHCARNSLLARKHGVTPPGSSYYTKSLLCVNTQQNKRLFLTTLLPFWKEAGPRSVNKLS